MVVVTGSMNNKEYPQDPDKATFLKQLFIMWDLASKRLTSKTERRHCDDFLALGS